MLQEKSCLMGFLRKKNSLLLIHYKSKDAPKHITLHLLGIHIIPYCVLLIIFVFTKEPAELVME